MDQEGNVGATAFLVPIPTHRGGGGGSGCHPHHCGPPPQPCANPCQPPPCGPPKMSCEKMYLSQGLWCLFMCELFGSLIFFTIAYASAACTGSIVQIGLAHGLSLAVAVTMFYCDANPAITIIRILMRRLNLIQALVKIAAQFLAAVIAAVIVHYAFTCDIGDAVPSVGVGYGDWAAFSFELVGTMFLTLPAIWNFGKARVPVGFLVGLILLACNVCGGGAISGSSLNPFRALGPSLFGGFPTEAWLYYVVPPLGAFLAYVIAMIACPAFKKSSCKTTC